MEDILNDVKLPENAKVFEEKTVFLEKEYNEMKKFVENKLKKLNVSGNMKNLLMEDIDEILIKFATIKVKVMGYGFNVMRINSGMAFYYL